MNRSFNYQDPDSSEELNRWHLGIIEPGLYRGFDPVLGSSMNLELNHSVTGSRHVKGDGTAEVVGIVVTQQGVVIRSGTPHSIPILSADPTNDRIDVIVVQQSYDTTVGGGIPIIVVINGVPASNPVPPALTLPDFQTVLGQLRIPAGVTSLNSTGVSYSRASQPSFANQSLPSYLARLDVDQTFSGTQSFVENDASYTQVDAKLVIGAGNFFKHEYGQNGHEPIHFISERPAGTRIAVRLNPFLGGASINTSFIHDSPNSVPFTFKKIYNPTGLDLTVTGANKESIVELQSIGDYWIILGVNHSPGIPVANVVGDSGNPAFETGWGVNPGEYVKYRKISHTGQVEVYGQAILTSSSPNSFLFTLPTGYRPDYTAPGVAMIEAAGVKSLVTAFVETSGNLRIDLSGVTGGVQGNETLVISLTFSV